MDAKIAKLQTATDEAESELKSAQAALEDSETRLDAAKQLLKQLDPEEQMKIQVNDTKLPELLELHALAKDRYETAKGRFETNQRYLKMFQEKALAESSSRPIM